jgi:pimeloyl-ACP methyl ester carboxylesterase
MSSQSEFPLDASDEVRVGPLGLPGILKIPPRHRGLVLFAHGSGSSRFSSRNRQVAEVLNHAGLATLLFDLLTQEEGEDRELVFDIELLAERMQHAAEWALREAVPQTPLGYFGASTGAAAALVAAARHPQHVKAVVSRGGRPDLAHLDLPRVHAPTLLIVGGHDGPVIEMNEEALSRLRCEKQLVIVPGATHLFPEPGALEMVASLAQHWFLKYLALEPATTGVEQTG